MAYKENRRGKKKMIFSSKDNGLPNSLIRLANGILDSQHLKGLGFVLFRSRLLKAIGRSSSFVNKS